MKTFRVWLTSFCLPFFGLSGHAMDFTNQTLAPLAEQNELKLHLNYQSVTTGLNNSLGSSSGSGFVNPSFRPDGTDSNISYYYGWSKNASFGLGLGFQKSSLSSTLAGGQTTTIKTSGLGGVTLGYKGNAVFEGAILYSALSLEFPLGTNSTSNSGDSVNSTENAFPISRSVNATAGPVFKTDDMLYGFLFRYTYERDGKFNVVNQGLTTATTATTVSGGDSLVFAPMLEWRGPYHPNMQISLGRIFGHREKTNGASVGIDGYDYGSVALSGRYDLDPQWQLGASFSETSSQPNANLSSGSWLEVGLNSRFVF